MKNPLVQLYAHMQSNGVGCNDDILLDDQIHRYACDTSPDRSEWYIGSYFTNNHVICTYGSFRKNEQWTFRSYQDGELSAKDIEEYKKRVEEQIKINEEERKGLLRLAKKKAETICSKCYELETHPYLEKKGIKKECLGFDYEELGQCLALPYYDINEELQSVQIISAKGEKRFLTKVGGSFHTIGIPESSKTIYVVEGFATGYSIYLATKCPVFVCGSDRGITSLIEPLKEKYSDKNLILCADNGDAGKKVIKHWTNLTKFEFFTPPPGYSDFNDLHLEKGIEAVSQILLSNKISGLTLDELFDMDLPEMTWLIEDFINTCSINCIYANTGVGKTFFSLEMAYCISHNLDFIGKKCLHKKILYIDGEMGSKLMKKRLFQIASDHNQPLSLLKNFTIITFDLLPDHADLNLAKRTTQNQLDEYIANHDVVFFDNYLSLTNTTDYDKQQYTWDVVYRWLKPWTKKGKTFVILNHTDKQGTTQRGAGEMLQKMDHMFQLVPPNKPEPFLTFTVKFVKQRNILPQKCIPLKCSLIRGEWKTGDLTLEDIGEFDEF